MITQEEFFVLHKLASSMKRDVLCLTTNTLYASDSRFSGISIMHLDKSKYLFELETPICYYKNDITVDPTVDEAYINKVKFGYTMIDHIMLNNDTRLLYRLNNALNSINLYKYNKPIHIVEDLKQYDKFMEIHNSKAAVGGSIINIDNYPIFVSPTLHPLNKSDTISLTIYPVDNKTFLTEYIITKKKTGVIYEYFRNRYL